MQNLAVWRLVESVFVREIRNDQYHSAAPGTLACALARTYHIQCDHVQMVAFHFLSFYSLAFSASL